MNSVAKNKKTPMQFTTVTLLSLTTFVAALLVLLPTACQVYLEIVCLLALFLCTVAFVTDIVPKLSNVYFRRLLSGLLVIVAVGLGSHIVQVLQGKVDAIPLLPMVLTISLAVFRRKAFEVRKLPIPWSAVSLLALAGLIAWQFYQTSTERYFVNRFVTSWGATQDAMRDGCVNYGLRSQHRGSATRSSLEIDTLFEMLDQDSMFRPITKHRFVCGSEAMDSLSFLYAMNENDWRNLQHMSALEFLDFSSVQISSANAKSFESLSELRQLSFLGCKLPSGFLNHCKNAEELRILQIVECNADDLAGLSALAKLLTLNLRQTKVSAADLDQVANLTQLTHLDLKDTDIENAELIAFANSLKSSASLRRGRFKCIVNGHSRITEGLVNLIRSGAVNELVLARNELSEAELTSLKAVDPNVTVAPLSEDTN